MTVDEMLTLEMQPEFQKATSNVWNARDAINQIRSDFRLDCETAENLRKASESLACLEHKSVFVYKQNAK